MVTNNNNKVNLEQVCSLNIEQSRLLQLKLCFVLFTTTGYDPKTLLHNMNTRVQMCQYAICKSTI